MAHFIDLNERFHVFSKSPVAAGQTLAGVRNKSGHTVTTSDIWGEDIPGFFKAYTADMKTAFLAFAKENDMCEYDGTLYYCKEGAWHARPALVADEKFYNESAAKSKDKVYNDGVTNVGYAGSITPVIRYHQNRPATLLNDDNNNKAPGNNYSVRIYPSDDSVNFVSSFVSSMDKFVNGTPSSKFDPVVVSSISTEGTLLEGTNDADYIANCYAGIIQFNKTRANAPTTITISAFEYIGKKLDSTINSIYAEIESIIGATMEGVVASVGVTTDAENAGISVDDESKTSPKIHITTGSITSSDAKLVTGKAVYDYVAGATLNNGTQGDNQIQSATGDTANKLVTAAQVKEYVTENAQVTVTVGQTKKTSTGFEFAGTTGTDISVAPTMDANGKVTYAATLSKATVGTDGKILTGDEAKAVSASDAKTIVDTSIAALSATGGAIATLTERVGQAESNAAASASAASASQTAAEGAKSEAAASKTAAQNAQTAAEGAQSAAQAAQAASEAAKGEASASASAAQGSATSASQSATAAQTAQQQATASAQSAAQAAADAKAAKEFVEATAEWQAGTEDTLGDFTSATASGVVTGTTVKTVADEVLTLAKSYSDSLHTTSLDYVVLGDNENLPIASADTLGKIYLVKEGNNVPYEADIDAISGSYVEYMTRKVSEGVYAWEKIGTTAADLSGYVKSVKINSGSFTPNATTGEIDLGTVVKGLYNSLPSGVTGVNGTLPNASSVYAGINGGYMGIGVADASTTGKGLVQIASDVASNSSTAVTTAAAVKTYADTKVGDVEYFGENDLISSKAEIVDGVLKVTEKEITWTRKNHAENDAWNPNITKVVNNEAFIGSTKYATVETNNLKDGTGMFYVSNLSEFSSDLSSLENGKYMFYDTKVKSIVEDMPKLTEAYSMFDSADIETFIGDLSSLEDGGSMFNWCNNLETFIGDLSSLKKASGMFHYTKLSVDSVSCIADTVANCPEDAIDNYRHLAVSWNNINSLDEPTRVELVGELSRIVDKEWTLQTNQELLPLFDSEKYQTGESKVQPIDLDSEPQTIYYVVKK